MRMVSPVDIDMYWADLSVSDAEHGDLSALLSPNERHRATLFHDRRDARRFEVCRGKLRLALSTCMGAPPASIAIDPGPHGKPFAADGPPFNVSHCADAAVFAIARSRRIGAIGVDVERVRAIPEDVASIAFSELERQALAAARAADRLQQFYRIWTRKEAVAKALGDGLLVPMHEFSVSAGVEAKLLDCAFAAGAVAAYRLAHFAGPQRMIGAVAAHTNGAPLALRWVAPPVSLETTLSL